MKGGEGNEKTNSKVKIRARNERKCNTILEVKEMERKNEEKKKRRKVGEKEKVRGEGRKEGKRKGE